MKKDEIQFLVSWLNEQIEFTSRLLEQAHQTKNYGKEVEYEAMNIAYHNCLDHLPDTNG
ncbi:MAG: hypothetical protein JKY53_06395 [Flavobacteriales bacterium]|nr:hypothetical protein [Flavobacteriales bacterium]